MRSIADPLPRSALARFAPAFGQRFLLTVDTAPPPGRTGAPAGEEGQLHHLPKLARFQQFCEAEGVAPIYLVDWPTAQSPEAAEILRGPAAAGKAEIGVQLDHLSKPPFEDGTTPRGPLAGSLRPEFDALRRAIEARFQIAPVIARAAVNAIGGDTAAMLAEGGIALDNSVRSKFDCGAEGGPDFRRHPLAPYWLDDERRLLELPATTVFWGLLRRQGDLVYPALERLPSWRRLLARAALLERIPLTPEGISVDEAIRGIDIALDDGLPLLVFSVRSPSLRRREEADPEQLHDWWRRVFAYLELRGVAPTTAAGIMQAVER